MEFISVLVRRTSNEFLRRPATLKEIPQKAIMKIFTLSISSRIERVSEAASNERLSSYLEPISEQPRRLFEIVALSESEMRLPDLMPAGALAALHARVLKAFFSRSVVFRAPAKMDRRHKHDHLSSKPASSASPSFNDFSIGHGRNS
jgi:hypothetical protein